MSRALTAAEEQRVIQLFSSQLLDEHGDVSVSGPTDGFVLTWVSANDQWEALATSGSGVDHGALTGLLDDDHPQYVLGEREMLHFFDGSVVETPTITVTESGGAVFLNLEASGGGDLQFFFDSVLYTLDCTPILSIILTTGVPYQKNYLYVTESGGTLTLEKSTTGFPTTAHAPIATVNAQAAADVAIDGGLKVHAWTDHVKKEADNGHLSHLNEKFRNQPASWVSGVSPSDLSSGQMSTSAGSVFQLHPHVMPARTMSTGDPLFVANDSVTAFKRITDLDGGGVDSLSDGTAINNGRYVNLVVIGVVNEAETDCKLVLLLPDSQYTTSANAQADTANSAVYDVGADFTGTSFLIARYTVQYSTGGGGSFSQILKTDLRGLFPSTSPGGGAITDHGNLSGLTDDDHTQYHTDARALTWLQLTPTLIDLSDVNSSTVPISNDILKYNSGLGEWLHLPYTFQTMVDVSPALANRYDSLSMSNANLWTPTPGGLIQLKNNAGVTAVPSSFGAVPWDSSVTKVGQFTHSTSTNNSEITCLKDGFIEIDVNLCFLYTSGGGGLVQAEMQLNSGGWATITGTARREQVLNSAGSSASLSINWGMQVTVDDKIRVRVKKAGGVSSMPANEQSIKISYKPMTTL